MLDAVPRFSQGLCELIVTPPQRLPAPRWMHGECQLNPPDAAKEFTALTASYTRPNSCHK